MLGVGCSKKLDSAVWCQVIMVVSGEIWGCCTLCNAARYQHQGTMMKERSELLQDLRIQW